MIENRAILKINLKLLITVLIVCAILGFTAGFAIFIRCKSEFTDATYKYAVGNVLCIGDSLTVGSCFGYDMDGTAIYQNYPYYLGRMLNAKVSSCAFAGASASDWYNAFAQTTFFDSYDTVIIWFGTNYGPTNRISTDMPPYSDSCEYPDTETGYYCRIIDKIRKENPDCLIILMNVFASKNDVSEINLTLKSISEYYGLLLIDMSDMGSLNHPEYHAEIQNPHFGKTGNLQIAARICEALENYFSESPRRCEFGVHAAKDDIAS